MKIHDIPASHRFWVRRQGHSLHEAVAWPCMACAIQSIPIESSRIITDRRPGASQIVQRLSQSQFVFANVDLDRYGWVARQYGYGCAKAIASLSSHHDGPDCDSILIDTTPQRFGRGTDDVHEPATVAAAEAFLKGATA